jgi:hypothetical protein
MWSGCARLHVSDTGYFVYCQHTVHASHVYGYNRPRAGEWVDVSDHAGPSAIRDYYGAGLVRVLKNGTYVFGCFWERHAIRE